MIFTHETITWIMWKLELRLIKITSSRADLIIAWTCETFFVRRLIVAMNHLSASIQTDQIDSSETAIKHRDFTGMTLFALLFAFYGLLMAREPLWGDSSKLSLYVLDRDFGVRSLTTGMGHHSLLIFLGYFITTTTGMAPHIALSLISVASGAASVALLYQLLSHYTLSKRIRIIACLLFGFSNTSLFVFCIQESYGLLIVLWMLVLMLFHKLYNTTSPRDKDSYLTGIFLALSLLNHTLSVILFSVVLLPLLLLKHKAKIFIKHTLIALSGSASVLIPFFAFLMSPNKTSTTLADQLNTFFTAYVNLRSLPKGLVLFFAWIVFQYPVVFLIAAANIRKVKRLSIDNLSVHFFIIFSTMLFTSAYMIQRRILMMGIALPSLSIIFSCVLQEINISKRNAIRLIAAIPFINLAFYFSIGLITSELVPRIVPELRVNHWRPSTYYFVPFDFHFHNPKHLINEIDQAIPVNPNKTTNIITDFTFGKPLVYFQKKDSWRMDIQVIDVDILFWMENAEKSRKTEEIVTHLKKENSQSYMLPYPDQIMQRVEIDKQFKVQQLHDYAELSNTNLDK